MSKSAREKIDSAFKELLAQSPVEKISVTDICHKANVNRSTFYEYYQSKEELLCTLQIGYFDRLYDCVKDELYAARTYPEALALFTKIVCYHRNHCDEFRLLLTNNIGGIFETNLSVHLKQKILGKDFDKKAEFQFIYHFLGNLSAVSSWILEDMPLSDKELAEIIVSAIPDYR